MQCCDVGGMFPGQLCLNWNSEKEKLAATFVGEAVDDFFIVLFLRPLSWMINYFLLSSLGLLLMLKLYTQAEQLGPDDAWHCPSCNRKQEVVKRLALWSSPDILIVHLKRFKQVSYFL